MFNLGRKPQMTVDVGRITEEARKIADHRLRLSMPFDRPDLMKAPHVRVPGASDDVDERRAARATLERRHYAVALLTRTSEKWDARDLVASADRLCEYLYDPALMAKGGLR